MNAQDATQAASAGTVLYIEDDPVNVTLMREVFRLRPQWRLEVAVTGGQGIDAARRTAHTFLLVDMHLPDMGGKDVIAALRSDDRTRGLYCVALSADAMPERMDEAMDRGFDDYMTKPIDVGHLLERLDRWPLR